MAADIRLLEDLVNRAVDRLGELSDEREQLRRELGRTKKELVAADRKRESTDREAGEANWQAQKKQVVAALRDTLGELRGE